MIENISRYIEEGEAPLPGRPERRAADRLYHRVFDRVADRGLIPLLFMTGLIGACFREFAVTLSVAIAVSAVLSLTLTATMSAHMLRRTAHEAGRPAGPPV